QPVSASVASVSAPEAKCWTDLKFMCDVSCVNSEGGLQLFGAWQIGRRRKTEMIEELTGRAVEQRAAQFFGPAGDPHEMAVDQALEDFSAGDAADGFELGAGDRLAVRDDRERFDGRLGEARLLSVLVETGERGRESRQGHEAKAARDPLD